VDDLTVLYYRCELSLSPDCAEADSFKIDENVLYAAVATGHLDLVKWYIAVYCDGTADEPSLLESAVKHGQPHVADWLLAVMPQCCTSFSADRFDLWQTSDTAIFDWFDRLEQDHPALVQHFQPYYIAHSLAHEGQLELLKEFMGRHPQLCAKSAHLLNAAAYSGSLAMVEYAYGEMEKHFIPNGGPFVLEEPDRYEVQKAMASVASAGKLEIVEFLFAMFPGINWYFAVRDAVAASQVRVVRFLFKNGYESSASYAETRKDAPYLIKRLACICRVEGTYLL
jgi:hypothetical protein